MGRIWALNPPLQRTNILQAKKNLKLREFALKLDQNKKQVASWGNNAINLKDRKSS